MKSKLFLASTILCSMLLNSSCKKCYECTTNTATIVNTGGFTNSSTSTSSNEYCGTKDEVANYESVNTGNSSVGVPGASSTVEVRTNCNPK